MSMKRNAFTLIELLVVIFIIVLMTAISAAAIVSIRNERKVEAAALEVKNLIYQARSESIAPSREGVKEVKIEIKKDAPAPEWKLEVTEQPNSPGPIFTAKFASNIEFQNTYNLSFIADNPNTMGQLRAGSSKEITISDASGKKVILIVDQLTGSVDFKYE